MSSGYDKYFKTAQKNRLKTSPRIDMKKLSKASAQASSDTKEAVRQIRNGVANRKIKRLQAQFPTSAGVMLGICLLVALYFAYDTDKLEKIFSSIEVKMFGEAGASAPEKKKDEAKADPTKDKKEEKNSDKTAEAKDGEEKKEAGTTALTVEELNLFKSLEDRRKSLDEREAELKRLDEELQKQKEELDKRMVEVESVRKNVAGQLEEKVKVDQERVEQLVQFYSTMKAQQAAKIIEALNEDLAIEVLLKMKKKNAAEIMNLIDAQKAQKLSERFAGYRRK